MGSLRIQASCAGHSWAMEWERERSGWKSPWSGRARRAGAGLLRRGGGPEGGSMGSRRLTGSLAGCSGASSGVIGSAWVLKVQPQVLRVHLRTSRDLHAGECVKTVTFLVAEGSFASVKVGGNQGFYYRKSGSLKWCLWHDNELCGGVQTLSVFGQFVWSPCHGESCMSIWL